MRDLEGSINERAIVMVLAYVIGFATAFIVYSGDGHHQIPPSLISSPSPSPVTSTDTASLSPQVHYEDNVLKFSGRDGEITLSVHHSLLDANTAKVFTTQGVHSEIATVKTSPKADFVFFCEVHNEPLSCFPFIYDTIDQTIKFVRESNVPFPISTTDAESAEWKNDTTIVFGEYASSNPDTPWIVTR